MEGALHLKSKSANILKTYCTLTDDVLHPRSKSGNIFKCKSANIFKLLVHPQSVNFRNANKSSRSHLGLHRHPSWQRMDAPAVCATCASPLHTSPLSRGYATSTLQCHILPIHYIALSCPPLQKNICPYPFGDLHPHR